VKESDLRKWHRSMGIALAFFIIVQAGTGLLISLGDIIMPPAPAHTHDPSMSAEEAGEEESEWMETLEYIHHGDGVTSNIYRIIVGLGLAGMAVSGSIIFFKTRSRTRGW
jgi:hypothetical protein